MKRFLFTRRVAFAVAALTILGLNLSAIAAHPVPFRGRAEVVVIGQNPLPPPEVQLIGSATGQATHLGRFTRTETITFDFSTLTLTGTLTFFAADGDQLTAVVSGTFAADLSAAEGTYVFTDGTGRFLHASGQATFEAQRNDGGSFDVKFGGTIQY